MANQNNTKLLNDKTLRIMKLLVLIVSMVIVVLVIFIPNFYLNRTQMIIVFFLLATMLGILFGSETTSRTSFKFKLPGLIFSTVGATAIIFFAMFFFTQLSKPEKQIAVYHIYHENGDEVAGLDRDGVLKFLTTTEGYNVEYFIDDNTVIVVFPEQINQIEVDLRPVLSGPKYVGTLSYSGARKSKLSLGKDFKQVSQ